LARLPASFFARSPLEVAPELLGCLLVRESGRTRRVGRIVEVEAYLGDGSDAASHAHRGQTRRNAAMFGPPGRFYVYRSMGIHHCVNVVCEPPGTGAAVLLRAVEPLEGLVAMRRARGGRPDRELGNGPGKLCQAFGIDMRHDATSALAPPIRVERAPAPVAAPVMAGPRIGISRASDLPYRFFLDASRDVTRAPQNRAARRLKR